MMVLADFLDDNSALHGKLPSLDYVKNVLKDYAQMAKAASVVTTNSESVDDTSDEAPPVNKKTKKSVFSMIAARKKNDSLPEMFEEVDRYLNLPLARQDDCPILYWKSEAERLSTLATLSQRFLSIPASSGAVERLFSVAGAIGRSQRACIRISTMEKALCVRQYLINKHHQVNG